MLSLQNRCIIEIYNKKHIIENINNRLTKELKILYKYVDSSHLNEIENVDILLKYKFALLEIMYIKYNFYDCLGLVPKEFLKDKEFMSKIKNTKFYEIDKYPEEKEEFYIEKVLKYYKIDDNYIKKYDDIEWNELILGYIPDKYKNKQLLERKINDKITIYTDITLFNEKYITVKTKGYKNKISHPFKRINKLQRVNKWYPIYSFWRYGYHPTHCSHIPKICTDDTFETFEDRELKEYLISLYHEYY